MISDKDLDNWFTYHGPDGDDLEAYRRIRQAGHYLAIRIRDETPACADQTAAIRKVREAVMTANAARACMAKVGPAPNPEPPTEGLEEQIETELDDVLDPLSNADVAAAAEKLREADLDPPDPRNAAVEGEQHPPDVQHTPDVTCEGMTGQGDR